MLYAQFKKATCGNHLLKLVLKSTYKPAVVNKREALQAPCGFRSILGNKDNQQTLVL